MTIEASAPETAAAPEAPALSPRDEAVAMLAAKVEEAEASASDSAVEAAPADTPPAAESGTSAVESDEEPKEPVNERVAKRIAAAKKLETRAAREREEIRHMRAEIEARAKQVAEAEAKYKLLDEDPARAFEVLGLDPRSFLTKLATEHDPNALIAKKVTELEKQLQAEQEERKRIVAEAQRKAQEQEFRVIEQESTRVFVEHVAEHADKYPHLSEQFTPEEIAQRGWQVASEHAEAYKAAYGEYPDDSVIAEYLEHEAKLRAEKQNAWKTRLKKSSEPGQGSTAATAAKPRTLTNEAASQKSAAPKPWNEKEAYEDAVRIAKQFLTKSA